MKRFVKITAGVAGGVLLLAGAAAGTGLLLAERKMQRQVAVQVEPLTVAAADADVARGRYLYQSRGCQDCHGADGAGRVFIGEPGDVDGLYARGPNITRDQGVTARYTEADWTRTLRHGVKPDGRALFIMPSEEYAHLSDRDVAALIAYVSSLAPAQGAAAEFRLPAIVRIAYGFGQVRDAAEKIDHARGPAPAMTPSVSVEYGAYVAQGCTGCHGATLTGGKIAGGPPDWPAAADLSAGGAVMARYDTAEKFTAMLRSGRRPDGSAVSPVMPFEALRHLDDTEAEALRLYLRAQQRPPVATTVAARH